MRIRTTAQSDVRACAAAIEPLHSREGGDLRNFARLARAKRFGGAADRQLGQ
jgi:hypothetical protein